MSTTLERRLSKVEEKLSPEKGEKITFVVCYGQEGDPGYKVEEVPSNILWRPKK